MANLDYNIMSGLRPIQLESPQNQLMQAYQLKGAQEASQLNAMKMQEMQQERAATNALNAAYQAAYDPATGQLDTNKLRQSMASGGFGAKIPSIEKSLAETRKEQLGQQKAGAEVANLHFAQAHDYLSTLDPKNPNTLNAFKQLTVKLFENPSTGDVLKSQGADVTTALKNIDMAAANGTLGEAINRGMLTAQQFALTNPARIKAAEDQLSQDYSDYLAGGGTLTRSQFKTTQNRYPAARGAATMPAVTDAIPTDANVAPVDVNAPVVAAPVSRVDANGVLVQPVNMGARSVMTAMPAAPAAPADVAAPAAAVVAPAPGKRLELPGIHPEAAKLYSTRLPEDKIKADAIQRVHESQLKSEDKKSSLAQLQDERAALIAVNPKDPRIKQYNDAIRKETQWKPDDAPAISVAESSLISKAILEGRLDPAKVNSRNMKIIAGTLAMDPTANLKELNIDAVSGAAASKALATQSAKILTAANEADSMIKIVRNTSAKIDRSQYPNINAIQNAVSKGTGGKDIVALNTALNALVNSYARAINPTGVATVSDKNHAREIINSNYAAGQLDAILTVMEAEMNIAKASPGEAAAALKAGRNRPAGGAAAAPPAGFKLD